MRLWTLHPSYLDRIGLLACWRESLLAQKVLRGETRGYTRHPQLERFRDTCDPVLTIGAYLHGLADEAAERGYRFDRDRIVGDVNPLAFAGLIDVTYGQVNYEARWFRSKLGPMRSPEHRDVFDRLDRARYEAGYACLRVHPIFQARLGSNREPWERGPEVF